MIYLQPDGKSARAEPRGEIERLVHEGYLVAAMDLVGSGELGPGAYRGDSYDVTVGQAPYGLWFGAVLVGKSFVGLQAADVVRVLRVLRERSDVSGAPVRAVAIGAATSALQHAAAFEPEIGGVALIEPLLSYASLATTRYYRPELVPGAVAGMLTAYDLPDLQAAIAPRPVLLINPIEGSGARIDLEAAGAAYTPDPSASGPRIVVDVSDPVETLLRWLSRT